MGPRLVRFSVFHMLDIVLLSIAFLSVQVVDGPTYHFPDQQEQKFSHRRYRRQKKAVSLM